MTKAKAWEWLKKLGTYIPLALLVFTWFSDHDRKIKAESRVEYLEKALADTKEMNTSIEQQWRADVKEERKDYLDWVSKQKPIITQATNTVREYAKTTDGQSVCLDASGVQRFQEQRRLIEQADRTTSAP